MWKNTKRLMYRPWMCVLLKRLHLLLPSFASGLNKYFLGWIKYMGEEKYVLACNIHVGLVNVLILCFLLRLIWTVLIFFFSCCSISVECVYSEVYCRNFYGFCWALKLLLVCSLNWPSKFRNHRMCYKM